MDNIDQVLSENVSKRLARLVAVQVLYQESYDEEPLADIMKRARDEVASMLCEEGDEGDLISDKPDMELLGRIVNGVIENREPLDLMLSGALSDRASSNRMEKLFKAVFLSGVYELLHHKDVDAAIIINDYVDVTKAFFQGKEPGLVNAVLDRLAKKIRS